MTLFVSMFVRVCLHSTFSRRITVVSLTLPQGSSVWWVSGCYLNSNCLFSSVFDTMTSDLFSIQAPSFPSRYQVHFNPSFWCVSSPYSQISYLINPSSFILCSPKFLHRPHLDEANFSLFLSVFNTTRSGLSNWPCLDSDSYRSMSLNNLANAVLTRYENITSIFIHALHHINPQLNTPQHLATLDMN